MRKLVWFTWGFAAACAVGVYLVTATWLLPLCLVTMGSAIGCCFIKHTAGRAVKLVLVGAAAAFLWIFLFDKLYLSHARAYHGQEVETIVTVTDYSKTTDYGASADATIALDGRSYRVRIYFYDDTVLSPGDKILGNLSLRYTVDADSGASTYHKGNGLFLLGSYKEDFEIIRASQIPRKYFAAQLRRQITGILDSIFPEDTLALARALLIGDSSLLSYKENTDLSVSGIRHIVAVSGLHVSILFSLVFVFFGYRRVITPLIGIPVLVVFAALAGFSPSVVRACVMQGLVLLALMLDKEYDAPTALAFAVMVLLCVNPMTITSVSLQLSAGCMVGILAFSEKINTFLTDKKRLGPTKGKTIRARLKRWFVGSVSVTLSAMVVTTPLCAWYFGTVSIVGILTNLLTLWAVTYLFCGIMAACAAGALWLPLGRWIAWAVSWIARYVMGVAGVLASFPMAAVYTKSVYVVIWLVSCYVLLGVFLLCKRKRAFLLAASMVAGLMVAVFLSWLEPKLDQYRVTVFDVGQGQCILLQTGGQAYLVDCGSDGSVQAADQVSQTLLSQGISRLDGLILTHYDTDHAADVSDLLSRIPAQQIYLPDMDHENPVRQILENIYSDRIQWILEETQVPAGEGKLTLFPAEKQTSDNQSGLCILFQPENCDILITGDRDISGERDLLKQTQLPDLEVLVVGHHGSAYSTGIELLHATYPEIAVVSAGLNNRFGHPTQEVLNRLELFGCQVLRTDYMGTIIIRG